VKEFGEYNRGNCKYDIYPGAIGNSERFLVSCPDYLYVSPAVKEVAAAYWYTDKGSIDQLYPHGTPCVMLEAVRHFGNGVGAGGAEYIKDITDRGGNK